MRQHVDRTVWGTLLAAAVMLAIAGGGCLRDPSRVKWTASGVQVTRLEMPLAGSGYTFLVGEYALDGREGPEPGGRAFRDRILLTAHLRGRDGQVLGFGTRTYADGTTRAYGLSGTLRPVGTEPRVMVVAAWAHPIRPDGPIGFGPAAWVELRLDPRTGRISAEAP